MRLRTILAGIGLAALATLATPAAAQTGSFVFGGVDASQEGYFGFIGGGVKPSGDIDESGLVLRGFFGGGAYQYDVGGPVEAEGTVTTADVMVGYQSVGEQTRVSVYVGANYQDHEVDNDPLNPVQGDEWGAKVQGEIYSQPSDNTMFQAIGSYSTANKTYFGLAKFGWKITDTAYLGPEFAINGNERYDQWRAGAHVTGFNVGPVGFNIGVGYVDGDDESGAYGQVGFTFRY